MHQMDCFKSWWSLDSFLSLLWVVQKINHHLWFIQFHASCTQIVVPSWWDAVLRCFSAHRGCKEIWVTGDFLSAWTSLDVLLRPLWRSAVSEKPQTWHQQPCHGAQTLLQPGVWCTVTLALDLWDLCSYHITAWMNNGVLVPVMNAAGKGTKPSGLRWCRSDESVYLL